MRNVNGNQEKLISSESPLTLCATSSLSLAPGAHPVDVSGPGLAYSSDMDWSRGVEAHGQRNNLERQAGLALGVLWLGGGNTPEHTVFASGQAAGSSDVIGKCDREECDDGGGGVDRIWGLRKTVRTFWVGVHELLRVLWIFYRFKWKTSSVKTGLFVPELRNSTVDSLHRYLSRLSSQQIAKCDGCDSGAA